MASNKEYLEYILGQLSELEEITYRTMMGEFILYYRGKIVGGIYDDRLLVKPVKSAVRYMPTAPYELPYDAQTHFPCKLWDAGEKGLTLSAFEWEKDRKTLIYGQVDYMYGEALYKPEMKEENPIRLYSLDEITKIFGKLGLRICNSFADFSGKPSSDNDIQLMVYSIRE